MYPSVEQYIQFSNNYFPSPSLIYVSSRTLNNKWACWDGVAWYFRFPVFFNKRKVASKARESWTKYILVKWRKFSLFTYIFYIQKKWKEYKKNENGDNNFLIFITTNKNFCFSGFLVTLGKAFCSRFLR